MKLISFFSCALRACLCVLLVTGVTCLCVLLVTRVTCLCVLLVTGVTCLCVLLVTGVTSSLLPANADVKNVRSVISTYTFIHNVGVQS